MNITLKDLMDAGVHFGHQVRRWNPKSKPYVYDHRSGVSIINLEKTFEQLQKASEAIEEVVASGKDIMFVGTKRQAQEILREAATMCNMPYCVNRWLGGTLTNFETIQSSLKKYRRFLNMEASGELDKLYSKEAAAIRREMDRMNRNFEGIKDITKRPAIVFIVDIKNEEIAVSECNKLGIPTVALVDTNSDPTQVTYPIPGNDDAVKSIRLITEVIVEAVQNGLSKRVVAPKAAAQAVVPVAAVSADGQNEQPEVKFSADIDVENVKDSDDAAKPAKKTATRARKPRAAKSDAKAATKEKKSEKDAE